MDAERRAGGPFRIIVADDDGDTRRLVARMFGELDEFDVVGTAGDMTTTRELVATRQPDVVVLDRVMPGFTGPDTIDGLRALRPNTAIVLLSGYGRDDPESAAVGAVVDGYVEKGAPKRVVVRTVVEAVQGTVTPLEAIPLPTEASTTSLSPDEIADALHDGPVAALAGALWTLDALEALDGGRGADRSDEQRRTELLTELRTCLRSSLESTRRIVRLAREHADDARSAR